MPMWIFEIVILLAGAALFGVALGYLLYEAYGTRLSLDAPVEPWLRPLDPLPAPPSLPPRPALLDDAERARLLAAVAGTAGTARVSASPGPVVISKAAPPIVAPALPIPTANDRTAAADAAGTRPVGSAVAEGGAPDDLERIKGIGPQNAARLHELGIWRFAQIAAWSRENILWVGTFLAFPGRIEREDWVGQARAFAAEKPASDR